MTLENLSALSLSQQIIVALIPDTWFRVFAIDGYSHVGGDIFGDASFTH